jgi:hypothetical protein
MKFTYKITMKAYRSIFFLFLFWSQLTIAQKPEAGYSLVKAESYVQSKNYYLLTLFEQLPEIKKLISNDAELLKIAAAKRDFLSASLKDCGDNVNCYFGNVRFSDAEIQTIGNRLAGLYATSQELKMLVKTHLIPSGCYILYKNSEPQELLKKAWEQDAKAVNHAIEVYGARSKKPNYPSIDSISFNIHSKDYPVILYDCSNTVLEDIKGNPLFFMAPMDYALRLIEINDRNRAADYEPMEENCNKPAYDRIKTIHWSDYAYSLILVPGEGPEIRDEALSAIGMMRCRVAAYRWRERMAPFIVVSGGKAHPYKTKYCEAEEMKKYLMETMHIPENVIIMEPHARHTTTNMRNCARLIFRYGIPMDKPCITSTTKEQSFYITDKEMQDRCMEELGYSPYANGKRLSETEAEFYPNVTSLQIDFDEPMDP